MPMPLLLLLWHSVGTTKGLTCSATICWALLSDPFSVFDLGFDGAK